MISAEHYNYFRDYDATIGKYIQSDPIGLQGGTNTFTYVGNNPLVRIDPLGQQFLSPQGAAALGIIGGGYFAGSAVIGAFGHGMELYLCYRDARAAQDALNAAIQACGSYPQGGACNALGFFQQQRYRAAAALTAAGGRASADDFGRGSRRKVE